MTLAVPGVAARVGNPPWMRVVLLLLCVATTGGYVVLRQLVYADAEDRQLGWFTRDTLMTLPRLLGLLAALGVMFLGWRSRVVFPLARAPWQPPVVGAGQLLPLIIRMLLQWEQVRAPGWTAFMIYCGTTAVVALFEEVLYRGAWLNALHDLWGKTPAMFGSSLAFTVFHLQAQPVLCWPHIFLCGLVAASLRQQGVSLAWLVGIHWALDMLGLVEGGYSPATEWLGVLQLILLTAVFRLSQQWQLLRQLAA